MARSKHSTALFEVIHSGRASKQPLLRTPSWWFKKSPGTVRAEITSLREIPIEPREPEVESDRDEDPTARASGISSFNAPAAAPNGSSAEASTPSAAPGKAVDVRVDPERQQISFKVTYSSAIIAGFALIVAVALAYLVGQKMNRGPAAAMGGQTEAQLRAQKPDPSVLDVGGNRNANSPAPMREAEPAISSRSAETDRPNTIPQPPVETAPARRDVNLNYIVIQSYPDEKSANEARDALIKAGVGCTVETKLRGLNPQWFTVIGTRGFTRLRGPEYEAYIARLNEISDQFAKDKRSFKAFSPMGYKWGKTS